MPSIGESKFPQVLTMPDSSPKSIRTGPLVSLSMKKSAGSSESMENSDVCTSDVSLEPSEKLTRDTYRPEAPVPSALRPSVSCTAIATVPLGSATNAAHEREEPLLSGQ